MGIASSPPRLERDELKPRDPKRKNRVLELEKEGKRLCTIAADANCSTRYVRKIILHEQLRSNETDKAQKGQWYQGMSDKTLEDLLVRIDAARTGDRNLKKYTSNLSNPEKVRLITELEREANTFPHSWTDVKDKNKGVEWVRAHLTGSKVSSQGFVIMKGNVFEPSRDFVRLLERKEYKKYFYNIFQELQSTKKSGSSSKGDGKRWQVKMGNVFKVAAQNVREAAAQLDKKTKEDKKREEYKRVLQEKQAEFDVVDRMLKHQRKIYNIIYEVSLTNHT